MNAVIIFAKYPAAGSVKTRLGKTLGAEFAARFYKAVAEHTFQVCLSLPKEEYDIIVFYDKDDETKPLREWIPPDFQIRLQKGSDLGDKMKNAFKLVFGQRYKKVIIIGTDCPDLNTGILLKSFRELTKSNILIGPSTDGGYYLLGMNRFYPFLFDGIEWSSTRVLKDTINKVKAGNLSNLMLPELIDIDTEIDLKEWLSKTKRKNKMTELIDEYRIR